MSNFLKMTNIKAIFMSSKNATLRLLPRTVQQLNLLPTVHMVSHFLHPRADKKPHFHSPIVPQLSKYLKFEAVRGD